MKITIQREQLYNELWSTPMKQVQERYGVTYHRLCVACKKHNIPRPPSGYWAKIESGKKVKQSPLPESDTPVIEFWTEQKKEIDLSDKLPKKVKPIIVKKTLRNPHPLVKKTYDHLKDHPVNQFNRVSAFRSGYLDVSVAPDSLKRAMRILDALVKELVRQGFSIGTESENRCSKSYITIGQEQIYFQIREEGYRETVEPDPNRKWSSSTYKYFTNGKLKLGIAKYHFSNPCKTLRKLKSKTLEERLNEFFPIAFELAAKMKQQREEWEREDRIREEKRKLYLEAKQQINEELERLKALEESAKLFTKSQYIYDLIDKVEEEISKREINDKELLQAKAWLHWARNHAGRLDPVKKTVRSIFKK
jgi:hypothetical protein